MSNSYAHDLGDGVHLTTIIDEASEANSTSQINWEIDITLQELLSEFPDYDVDENGRLSPLEYGNINAQEVSDYVLRHLKIMRGQGGCSLDIQSYNIITHNRADFLQFALDVNCSSAANFFQVNYDLFFDQNPYHQGTWTILYQQQPSVLYFWEDERARTFQFRIQSWVEIAWDFFLKGIHHIGIGFDHILFLMSLLLPVVLIRKQNQWQGVVSLQAALWNLAKIITAFTLAHSLTLSLAVIGWVPLPPGAIVESMIALSVFIMAFNNIKVIIPYVYWVTFAFGLIHGFGFANVLLEYNLQQTALMCSLVAFNVGVEFGQLMFALLAFFPLYHFRHHAWYQQRFMPGVSILICIIAAVWFIQRAAGVAVL